MDHDLRWIRQTLASFGERDAGFRYPEEFRRRVVRYAQRRLKQTTTTALSKEVGVCWVTIRRWRDAQAKQEKPTGKLVAPQGMVPIRVTDVEDDLETSAVTVITPSNWRVEGLSLAQVIKLLERCA